MNDPLRLLSQRHGEGRVTWRALQTAGFLTLGSIAAASLEELSDRARLSARSAGRLQAGARELISEGIAADLPTSLTSARSGRPARPRRLREDPPPAPGAAPRAFSQGVTPDELAILWDERTAPGLPRSVEIRIAPASPGAAPPGRKDVPQGKAAPRR